MLRGHRQSQALQLALSNLTSTTPFGLAAPQRRAGRRGWPPGSLNGDHINAHSGTPRSGFAQYILCVLPAASPHGNVRLNSAGTTQRILSIGAFGLALLVTTYAWLTTLRRGYARIEPGGSRQAHEVFMLGRRHDAGPPCVERNSFRLPIVRPIFLRQFASPACLLTPHCWLRSP